MDQQLRITSFLGALRMIAGGEPRDLVKRAQLEAEEKGASLSSTDLTGLLRDADANSAFMNNLGLEVHRWDASGQSEPWTNGTSPSTPERRQLICAKLGIEAEGAAILLEKRPIYHDRTVVITAPWARWYSPDRAREREFYWPKYRDYLIEVRRFSPHDLTALDQATTDVIERLADPARPEAYQSKGLVVGYVQSGKTANFTGVAAKAIDAGYRLIIIMTGTIELLRSQTQRRIDMELVGRQNILGDYTPEQAVEAKVDYQDDEEWLAGRFLDLGISDPTPEIRRLTHHRRDYQRQFKTLKIERFDASRPFYDPENLFRSHARLVVVKKNSAVLKKLVSDIRANTSAFDEIPVLIIDDESDQASVNTIDPERVREAQREGREIRERRAINERIADMLELMPRAQYVGYTATPFANVFVDPSDPQGIFPKDFVVALDRPDGYMGVDDFHDLGNRDDGPRTYANSNELAFVRDLVADEDDEGMQEEELLRAIDMFVLTGAVKLYRQQRGLQQFRHHTMLVHHSVRRSRQREMAETVRLLWKRAEYTSYRGKDRLRNLYETDVLPVSAARREGGISETPEFDDLVHYIAQAIGRVLEHDLNPVIVVNSDQDIQQQSLDFDRHSTWRILVGGAKLSRGFTVEGLTVTYFRRATNMSDSLTQMGRWFGFRQGYRDLVRLFIARKARFGRKPVDLYAAFEGVALDEAAFRSQLREYSEWDGDEPRIRPSQIPPLVSQHLPWLQPTARNKMFNAVLTEQSEQPLTPAGYPNHVDDLKANLDLWRPVFAAAHELVSIVEGRNKFSAYVGVVDAEQLIEAIANTRYLGLYKEKTVLPKLAFYRRLAHEGAVKDFLVVVPQPETERAELPLVGSRAVISRERRVGRGGKFGEMTEPKNRPAMERFVTQETRSSTLEPFLSPKRGAVLLYVARETSPDYDNAPPPAVSPADPEYGLVAAFSSYLPAAAIAKDRVLHFRVLDPRNKDAPTVDASSPS